MKDFAAIVLAAGKGTRMKSARAKVLHTVCGRPMLFYPLKVLKELGARDVVVVVGHEAREVKCAFKDHGVRFCLQREQLGTGHAVMCAVKYLRGFTGDVLILSGDVPLITKETVRALFKVHRRRTKPRPVLSFISVLLDDPSGYGRVIRDEAGRVSGVVEDRDLMPGQRDIREVNAGIYLVDAVFLRKNLRRLTTSNTQQEYYLPDLVQLAYSQGEKVTALTHVDPDEVMGVNNRIELARANSIMRERILRDLMLGGVTFVDPSASYVDYGVRVGRDTTVYPNVHLEGDTTVGKGCLVEEGVKIKDSLVGDDSVIRSFSIIESSSIGSSVSVGPFARIRPCSRIHDRARIGNFVEVKKSVIGEGSKANHLSYIGDAVVGRDVNIGAGAITCNYDGRKKYTTVIEDGAFIGSDSQLVAPVVVGTCAYIGSGSTITKDVPPGSLALSRAGERVIEGWVERRGLKKGSKKRK